MTTTSTRHLLLLSILALLLTPISAFAQGIPYENVVWNQNGFPVAGASITVCSGQYTGTPPCPTPATIYSDTAMTLSIPNPITTGSLGNYRFVVPSGTYTISITGAGTTPTNDIEVIGLPPSAALKPAASDAVQFVSVNGNDSNDGFSMGSAKATIAAAQTALPSGGGLIEVLPFTSLSLSTVQAIGTGVGGKSVQLRLDSGATITVNTNSPGSCEFQIGQGSSIAGPQTGQGNVGHIFFSSLVNLKYGICPAAANGTQQLWGLANLDIENVSGQSPTISDSVIYASTTGQNSSVQNVTVAGIPAALLHVQGSSVAGTGSFYFANDWFNCEAVAGCAPAKIDTVAGSQAVGNIFFFATDFEHSPSGTPEFNLDGSASPDAITNVSLVGSYCEGSFAANNCFNIKDAKSFHLQNITCDGVAGADCIHLSESTTTGLGFGTIENVSDPNGYTNLINDTINSNVLASPANSGALPLYVFTNPNFSEGPSLFSGAVETKSVASLSANPAQSGILRLADGDSIGWRNHANSADILLGKNISDQLTFGGTRIGQTIASGTATMTSGAITAASCQTATTVAASNVAATDAISWAYATAPTGTTDALLTIAPYVTSGNVNFTRCNPTAGSITGTAIVINWRVAR